MKKIVVVFSLLALALILSDTKGFAQTVALGVYPPIIQINATPPADISSPLSITNLSDNTLAVTLALRPFTPDSSQTGQIQLLPDNAPFSGEDPQLLQKVQILDGDSSVTQITLAPQQQKDLTLHIVIPRDEPPSDYYFSIVFTSNSIGSDQGNFSALSGGIATNVLLSLGPTDKTTGLIQEFSSPFFVQEGPVPFVVKIQNTSKHFFTPQGTILISDIFGKPIGKVNLLPVNILEHSSRFIPSDESLDTQFNFYAKSHPVAIWPEAFLLGVYKAHLTVSLSDSGPIFTRTIYFFAFPFSFLLGFILAIVITIFIILRVRKRLNH